MAQTLETLIRINASTGTGFGKVGATLTELGSIVDGLSNKLIDFGKESVEVFKNYQSSMADAEVALSTTYGRGTRELQNIMDQLDEAATNWAASTIFHTDDVSSAISEAAHAGWDYQQIMNGIPAALQLAQAGSMDLNEAVNMIVKSTNAAGISFEDLGNFVDLWTFAANSSASNIEEFGEAMLRMGSTMRFASNPEELMTLIAVTADAGSVGSEAGTMIRNSIMRLIAPTDKANKAMAELGATTEEISEVMDDEALAAANAELASHGFSVFDSEGNLRPILELYTELGEVMADIAGGYDNIGRNQDATRILGAIFPTRTITEALNLINAAKEGYGGLYDAMMNGEAEGYGQYASETMMDTLSGDIEIFESKVERLKQVVGGELEDQVSGVAEWLGGIVDNIAELDPEPFSALVGAAEGLAAVGPGLITAGTAFRLLGLLFSGPFGAVAAGVTALAMGVGALAAWDETKYENKFGDMDLDMQALDTHLQSLTTEAENKLAFLDDYVTQLDTLGEEYKDAMSSFSEEITMGKLTGEMTEDDFKQVKAYGERMTQALLEGINTRESQSLDFIDTIFADENGEIDPSDYDAYSGLFSSLQSYYDDLYTQAQQAGDNIQAALVKWQNGEMSDDEIDAYVAAQVKAMNEIQAKIQDAQDTQGYYTELAKAGAISKDSLDEYLSHVQEYTQQRLDAYNQRYYDALGEAWQAASADAKRELTWEEFTGTPQYQAVMSKNAEGMQPILDQQGEMVATAIDAALKGSDMGDSYRAAVSMLQMANRDANGNAIIDNDLIMRFVEAGGVIPETFASDIATLTRGSGPAGWGKSEWAKQLEPYQNMPGASDYYNLFGGEGYLGQLQSVTSGLDSAIASMMSAYQGMTYQGAAYSLGKNNAQLNANGEQTITVSVDGDTSDVTEDLSNLNGTEITAMVGADTDLLEMSIYDMNGVLLTEPITGDPTQLANILQQFQGKQIMVNFVTPDGQLLTNGKAYAEGGRADTASIFGEAGPEWAIPEAHTQRTANLLNAAAEASGFSWPELSGSTDNSSVTTITYAPVINAANAAGVADALAADKDRFTRWWEERQTRERAEVYR